jgi:hypothetical protein
MIPDDFIEIIKSDGNFAVEKLANEYGEISTKRGGKIAVTEREMKDFFRMLGFVGEIDIKAIDSHISKLKEAIDGEKDEVQKGRFRAAHNALMWVRYPDEVRPPLSLSLMCATSLRKRASMEEGLSAVKDTGGSEEFDFAVGTQWRTRGAGRAVIVDRRYNGFVHVWHTDGKTFNHYKDGKLKYEESSDYDIVEPWREPVKG